MIPAILAVDDNEENRYVLEKLLRGIGMEPILASNGLEALEKAKEALPDLIISDILMPIIDGFEFCRRCKIDERLARVPFIFYTATYTEPEDEAFALSLGADRFMIKPQEPDILIDAIRQTLDESKTRKETASAPPVAETQFDKIHGERISQKLEKKMEALEESNRRLLAEIRERELAESMAKRLSLAIDESPDSILFCALDATIEFVNARYAATALASGMDTIGGKAPFLLPGSPERGDAPLDVLAAGKTWRGETKRGGPNGDEIIESITAYPIEIENGRPKSIIAIIEDVTEKKRMEERLRRSQRLEELGKLASGVAHDFNNILAAVTGFSELILGDPNLDPHVRRSTEQISIAADRGMALTGTLLAFSRRQDATPYLVDLNAILREFEPFLRKIVPPGITLEFDATDPEIAIVAHKGQIEQVIMNLVTNARDAMPGGGTIFIRIARAESKISARALIEVRDSGMGMDEKTKSRIFEPFFTTKKEGHGTGLGLPLVYGIVEAHHGTIDIESDPGKGSIFRIYLPLASAEQCANPAAPHP
jgi:two-component system, cell cycle sensor histidine kinase and response regulator CckA